MVDVQNKPKVIVNGVPEVQQEKNLGQQILEVSQLIADIFVLIFQIFYINIESIYRLIVPVEPKSVRGEIVLITGSGHGIGRELALLYASAGATVVGWDVNDKNNEETIKEVEARGYPKAHAYRCDVSNRDDVLATAKRVQRDVGEVTILINNAGIMPCHPLLDHTVDEISRIMNINVLAHFWTLQAFLPAMKRANRGHIVAMSSCAGLFGIENLVPYCASKFAVRGMMEALHEELRAENNCQVKVTNICPYMVDTGLCKKPRIRFQSLMPLLKPEEVAKAIMTAQATNTLETTIPSYILALNNYTRMLPNKAAMCMKDFFNSGVDSDL